MPEQSRPHPEPDVVLGRTPTGQLQVETPTSILPQASRYYGVMASRLGDPISRYGNYYSGYGELSIGTMLKMLTDPIIAFSLGYIASKLVKAEYEIECADPQIKRFFEAMYGAFHREFMLQAAMAVALGSCGMIKQFEFRAPDPLNVGDPEPWTGNTTPLIVAGFRQVNPVGAYPTFDRRGKFTGFKYAEGEVDRIFALWLVMGRTRVFGNYGGRGRLRFAYKPWWLGEFNDDQHIVHIQKNIDRMPAVEHPTGKNAEGKDYSDVAIEIGDSLRSGATIALPSTPYTVVDAATGEEKFLQVKQWAVRFLEGAENVMAFIENADHFDARKALGMMVPKEIHSGVKQDVLGGPTSISVLGKLAVDLLLMEAAEIDDHLNEYLFPFLVGANFGADAPAVTKRTTGLNEMDREEYFNLLKDLIHAAKSDASQRIDTDGLAHRLNVPLRAPIPVIEVEVPAEEDKQVPDVTGEDADQSEEEEDQAASVYISGQLAPSIHTPRIVQETCPLCGYVEALQYDDHEGLCVCRMCGITFVPELE